MPSDSWRDDSTLDSHAAADRPSAKTAIRLTLLAHPLASRIGEGWHGDELGAVGGTLELSRTGPLFRGERGGGHALESPLVSRRPIRFTRERAAIRIDPGGLAGKVRIDGVPLTEARAVSLDALDVGVVLRVGSYVVVLLHRDPVVDAVDGMGMVGESAALQALRHEVRRAADAQGPVLIRGSSGSGKELVARALHEQGPRPRAPFVAVNLAAVPSALAASQLFGHVRGAFSGAHAPQDGLFVAADGGTLFLDEVGDAPDDVQAALLRVLETHEVLAVGATRPRRVDVRVVAATDADLEQAITEHRFRGPLYWRLAANELRVAPLRDRRADVARLLVHFLRVELAASGRAHLLEPAVDDKRVWLSADVVERLTLHPWPGNVRELRNLVRHLAARGDVQTPLDTDDLRVLADPPPSAGPALAARPRDITPAQLEAALVRVDWALGAAAAALGISRPALNDLVDAHPTLRRAKFLTDAELAEADAQAEATGEPAWRILRVSPRALARRRSGVDVAG